METYWGKRKNYEYYKKVIEICSEISKNNKDYSIIDFGCKDTEVIFDLNYSKKFLLDIENQYSELQKNQIVQKGISFITKSIHDINYVNEFDVCLCLQTIEHLDNPRKAFDLIYKASKKYIVISLPYKWKKSSWDNHTGIDEEIIKNWIGIDPNESYIVEDGKERIINLYIKN
jgi:SAM-dependent methyltransferase